MMRELLAVCVLFLVSGIANAEEESEWVQKTLTLKPATEVELKKGLDKKHFLLVVVEDEEMGGKDPWACPLSKPVKACRKDPRACFDPKVPCTELGRAVMVDNGPEVVPPEKDGEPYLFRPKSVSKVPVGKTTVRLAFGGIYLCDSDPTPCTKLKPYKESDFFSPRELVSKNIYTLTKLCLELLEKVPGASVRVTREYLETKNVTRQGLIGIYKQLQSALNPEWCPVFYYCTMGCSH